MRSMQSRRNCTRRSPLQSLPVLRRLLSLRVRWGATGWVAAVTVGGGAPADSATGIFLCSSSSEVPQRVKDSLAEAHKDPEAAANQEAVDEKHAIEELLL
jgi:hypothetical protein